MTQQFNTTTSMGRLTLNILLSFAQFERGARGLATDLRSTLQHATAALRDTTDPRRVAATLHTRLGDLLRTGSR